MTNYKDLYFKLAGTLANTIEELDNMSASLKEIQWLAEQVAISNDETE